MSNLIGFLAFVIESYCAVPEGITVKVRDGMAGIAHVTLTEIKGDKATGASFGISELEARSYRSLPELYGYVLYRVEYALAEMKRMRVA